MTKKLYWEDSYKTEFEASVVSVNDSLIELDQTCFFPTGGGEPNDTGKLIYDGEEFVVSDVTKNGDMILHKVDKSGLNVGDRIKGVIDWERRHRLMRMHTTSHILSAIIHNETGALISGGGLDLDKSRIDFNVNEFDREKFAGYVEKVNQLVKEGGEVKSYFMDRNEAMKIPGIIKLLEALPPNVQNMRIVEIHGIDMQADGGNHIKDIREIGQVEIVKMENKGKNNRRLYFTLKP